MMSITIFHLALHTVNICCHKWFSLLLNAGITECLQVAKSRLQLIYCSLESASDRAWNRIRHSIDYEKHDVGRSPEIMPNLKVSRHYGYSSGHGWCFFSKTEAWPQKVRADNDGHWVPSSWVLHCTSAPCVHHPVTGGNHNKLAKTNSTHLPNVAYCLGS